MVNQLQQLACRIWLRIIGALCRRQKPAAAVSPLALLLSQPHNCAPVALARVLPDLSEEDIVSAFILCCSEWPNGGVSNREFNITLRHIGVFNKFEYSGADGLIGDFMAQTNHVFIALVYGHYTVVRCGEIIDTPFNLPLSRAEKVYCSWQLIHSAKS